jgi:transcriptional/translational regulatory protein YebC/TACO1
MIPASRIAVQGKEAEQMERLLDLLEDLEDVLNVYSNCDFVEQA